MSFGLDDKTVSLIKNVFVKYPEIEKVIIYGSRALGNYKHNSDIDLAVVGNLKWDFIGHLLEELDSLSTPYLYDVTDYNRITIPELKKHIDDCGKIFYVR